MSDMPFVTVIMPIRNEADFIARSLGAVLAQDYPADRLEVLIADGMSTDATRAIIVATARPSPIAVQVIDNPGKIVPTGWNAAFRQARGDIIVRVDGHTIIAPDYVRMCVAALARTGADNVGGRMDAVGESAWARAIALATSSPFGVGGARFHYATGEQAVDTVYMGAWRRDVFERLGGFDERMVRNQDDEFNYRTRAAGGTIWLSDTIRSTYYNRATLSKLARQYYQYGYYKVLVLQKHPRQMSPRQFIPAVFVAGLIVGLPLALISEPLRWLYLAAILLYVVGNLVYSVRAGAPHGLGMIARLPGVFLTLHLAYGLGFWAGVAHFYGKSGRQAA
jgi:glycosyltransferase involved in cell wall biosynthesis